MTPATSHVLDRITAGTHARIDLDAYQHNIRTLMSMAPSDASFMAVVKGDAYGHGATYCARAAVEAGADWLGVARVAEALHLRQRGLSAPLLVLGPPNLAEIDLAVQNDITLTVGSMSAIDGAASVARHLSRQIPVHLKIDTGMHRYGILPDEAIECASRIAQDEHLILDGVFTHFACADEANPATTDEQVARFRRVVVELRENGHAPRYVHQANSAATLSGRTAETNLVRCGIATYGLSPSADVSIREGMRPIMSVSSAVARRFAIEPGEGVSYGLTWRAESHEDLADVPVGYADGLPRQLSNQGWFAIAGERSPIRGRICMDQTVAAAPATCREGDRVSVVGDGADGSMTLDDVAAMAGTINYEVATRLTARVPRIYIRGGRPVAWEHVLTGTSGVFE